MGANIVKWTVYTAAFDAAVIGLLLIVTPSPFAWLVLGADVSNSGQALGRLAGIALVGLGLAAWPAPAAAGPTVPTVRALLAFNVLVMIYLSYLGLVVRFAGILLWPAVAFHTVMSILLAYTWLCRAFGNEFQNVT